MISSGIKKIWASITYRDLKEVGVKIEDEAAEGRKGTTQQSGSAAREKKETKYMEGAS